MSNVKKPFYKKWWFYLLAVIVIIVLANSGGNDTPADTSTNGSKTAAPEAQKESKLNEEAAIGKLSYIASDVKKATTIGNNQYLQKTTENQYVIIKVKVTNNGDKSQTLDTSMFKLKDSSGKTFTASGEADTYINDDLSFFLQQVNPGTSKSGSIAFETPKDTKGLKLDVTGGMFSSKTATIDLAQ